MKLGAGTGNFLLIASSQLIVLNQGCYLTSSASFLAPNLLDGFLSNNYY